MTENIRQSGGYRDLHSFRAATVIYDGTVSFCDRFVDRKSRTRDQMVQAARSGRQNIAEGSRAAATSSQTELRLVNVARASLDELLLDFEDFLRQRGLPRWGKDDRLAREVRAVGRIYQTDPTDRSDRSDRSDKALVARYSAWLNHADPTVVANALICLIHQANYLLDRQIAALERQFVTEGGYSERLAAARFEHRRTQPEKAGVVCPRCGKPMVLRTARVGPNEGSKFWGCSGYPECSGTRRSDGSDRSVRSG